MKNVLVRNKPRFFFKLKFIIIVLFLMNIGLFAQQNIHEAIDVEADKIFEELVEIRRDLHRHPELSGKEERTSDIIAKYLNLYGLEVKKNIGGYGVVGILYGFGPGGCIAWRADIDAFEDDSPDVVDFTSETKGVRHICGHDVHTAIGLGIANVLSKQRENIQGTIMFIFQPSEENFKGANNMLSDGLFKTMKPSKVFALHIAPTPVGTIAVKPEEMFARRIKFHVELKNIKDDSGVKEKIDKSVAGLKQLKVENIFDVSLNDQANGLFSPNGALSNYFEISSVTQRESKKPKKLYFTFNAVSTNEINIDNALSKLENSILTSFSKRNLHNISVTYNQPCVFNNPELTRNSTEIIKKVYGAKTILPLFGIMPNFNDDFAYYLNETKGTYFFLGGSNYEKGIISMPHSPNFAIDEECIKAGVKYFASLLFESL